MAIESPLLMETLTNIHKDIRAINEKFDEQAEARAREQAEVLERIVRIEKDVVRVKTVWTTLVAVASFIGGLFSAFFKGV